MRLDLVATERLVVRPKLAAPKPLAMRPKVIAPDWLPVQPEVASPGPGAAGCAARGGLHGKPLAVWPEVAVLEQLVVHRRPEAVAPEPLVVRSEVVTAEQLAVQIEVVASEQLAVRSEVVHQSGRGWLRRSRWLCGCKWSLRSGSAGRAARASCAGSGWPCGWRWLR